MLYGCELYMVDSHLDICINTKDILLNNADYVIFDLETTGLSARYDRIIEFGATKYSHGQEYDKRDFFINPNRKLRDVIKIKPILLKRWSMVVSQLKKLYKKFLITLEMP